MLYEAWIFAWLTVASIRDLRYAEVEDLFAAVIGASGVAFHGYTGFIEGSWLHFLSSVAVGVVCLAVGLYAMRYELWADGDALLLGSVGFAFPRFQLFLIAAVAATGLIYTYAWKYMTGESKVRVVPAFPLALLGLHLVFAV